MQEDHDALIALQLAEALNRDETDLVSALDEKDTIRTMAITPSTASTTTAKSLSHQPLISFENDLDEDEDTSSLVSMASSGVCISQASHSTVSSSLKLPTNAVTEPVKPPIGGTRVISKEKEKDKENLNGIVHHKFRSSTPPSTSTPHTAVGLVVAPPRIMSIKEPAVAVERDVTPFETLPRLPLTKMYLLRQPTATSQTGDRSTEQSTSSSSSASAYKTKPISTLYAIEQAASLVIFTRNNRLALSAGRIDGSIAVREVG